MSEKKAKPKRKKVRFKCPECEGNGWEFGARTYDTGCCLKCKGTGYVLRVSRPKPSKKVPKKVRRVVLGVGHPWFYASLAGEGMKGQHCAMFLTREHNVFTDCPVIDSKGLGNWNCIRLVAEVLK